MDIYVLDKTFEPVAVIDSYVSVIWTTRYFTVGDFELYLQADARILDILQEGFYLVRESDMQAAGIMRNVMIIESREIVTDAENGDNLIITGRDLKSILKRRVISNQTVLQGFLMNCLKQIVTECIISPTIAARQISNFRFGSDTFTDSTKIKKQITGTNLEEAVSEICTAYGIGYDVYLQRENGGVSFVMYFYKGVDRSAEQDTNPHVIVSEEFDNLLSSDYKQSKDNYANVAYVAGEGEGNARKKVIVGNASGLDRYEVWVDARNASSNEGEISEAEYLSMLEADGIEALGDMNVTTMLSGEIINGVSFQINDDYFLGDIIQFENDYGISAATRVIEVIYNEDETGINMIPTFAEMEV